MIILAIFCYSHFEIDSRFLKNRVEFELVLWQADGRATCTRCYLAEHIRLKIEVFIWLWELISTVVEGTSISHWRVSNGVWDEFICLQIYGFLHWNNIYNCNKLSSFKSCCLGCGWSSSVCFLSVFFFVFVFVENLMEWFISRHFCISESRRSVEDSNWDYDLILYGFLIFFWIFVNRCLKLRNPF